MAQSFDPIAVLLQEHNEALDQLKRLNLAVGELSQHGYSKKVGKQLTSSLRYIEHEVKDHNRKEEDALFPILETYVEGPTKLMRSDHKKLRKGFEQLRKAIDKLQQNPDSFSAIKTLSTIAKDIVQLFVNHIHKENYILFPLVQKLLTKDELREVAKKML
ncbi:MAG: hemerythrin domain-containing protein [Bacteroidetes bacterium]|nr:MAG: hemerythrin domain-containing protein [Bacteroidota bacterium]